MYLLTISSHSGLDKTASSKPTELEATENKVSWAGAEEVGLWRLGSSDGGMN